MKKCICCGKEIHNNATVCRYCFCTQPYFIPRDLMVTSTPNIEGFEIIEYIQFLQGEVVVPNGLLGAFTSGTFFTIDALAKARLNAVEKLITTAREVGANAIVSLDVDINDLNGQGVMVSANGTAVYAIRADREFIDEKIQETRRKMAEKEQMEKDAVLKKQQANERLAEEYEKRMSELGEKTNNELSSAAVSIYSIIIKNSGVVSAMDLSKMLPRSIAPKDAMDALSQLEQAGMIQKNADGKYELTNMD